MKSAVDHRATRAAHSAASQPRVREAGAAEGVCRDSLVGPEWRYQALAMLVSVLLGMAISFSLPTMATVLPAALAAALMAASRPLLRFEGYFLASPLHRHAFMTFLVGVPQMLFGIALANWVLIEPSLAWTVAVGLAVLVSTIAVVLTAERLPAAISAITGLWAGFALLSSAGMAIGTALATTLGGLMLTIRHCRRRADEEYARIRQELAQNRAQDLLAEFEDSGQGWFWETDRRGLITYVSPRVARLLGKADASLVGKPFTSLFQSDPAERETERTLVFHLSTRSSFGELAVQANSDEDEERWWSVSGRPVMDQFHNFLGFRGFGVDLTEARKSQRHVTELARFDSLTKLANRFQMSEWLDKLLIAPRAERRACAVLMLDLDRFKQVNDTMGHPAGDALLRQVADRLRATVGEAGSVGRLGGDEFEVLLPGRHPNEALAQLAGRIIENLSQPYSIDGQRVTIGTSVGIAVCPDHGTTAEELIRNADLALYAAKDGGRGRHHIYSDDLHTVAEARRQIEQDLRDAIAQGGLELHYQPQVQSTTEMISGFEALLRWNHPEHGYLSPDRFIPIAENAGLIQQIGEWVLRTASAQLAAWPDSVRMAVNVSPLQFANPALPAIITSAIASAGIAPSRLELELTESVFLNDDKSTDAMFKALKGIGVRLALDDFGTGYSALGYLKKALFDKIKIDQGFIRGATIKGSRNGAIIAAIVSLAESLGMETTAEGVETLDELDLVRMLGCSHVQGYIYHKPLHAQGAGDLLARGLHTVPSGPRSARAVRQTMLRKVVLEHGEHRYDGTIRNISMTGALIEGLWNVPVGTEFRVHLASDHAISAKARWSREDRMGVEFGQPLELDENGAVLIENPPGSAPPLLRRAG